MTNKEFKQTVVNLKALGELTYTYQQIAAMRMRKVRESVIQTRSFYQKLLEVYQTTNSLYVTTYKKPYKSKTNGRRVAVLLTANTGLYGDIIRKVFDTFSKNHANDDFDLVVAGKLGKKWLEASSINKSFTYFDIPDATQNIDAYIKTIFNAIKDYDEAIIYHGLFTSIVNQSPTQTKITQKPNLKDLHNKTLSFLFEPTIEKVLESFDRQLLYSFFDQAVSEGNLAKYGSRMVGLDQSSRNISKQLEINQASLVRSRHANQNKKQLEQVFSVLYGG